MNYTQSTDHATLDKRGATLGYTIRVDPLADDEVIQHAHVLLDALTCWEIGPAPSCITGDVDHIQRIIATNDTLESQLRGLLSTHADEVDGGGIRCGALWVRFADTDTEDLQITDLPRDMPLVGGYGRQDFNRISEIRPVLGGWMSRAGQRYSAVVRDAEGMRLMHGCLMSGDYCDMGTVGLANVRWWESEHSDHEGKWWHLRLEGYGSTLVCLMVEPNGCSEHPDGWYADACDCDSCEAYRGALETIDALDDYPLIDDGAESEVREELLIEALQDSYELGEIRDQVEAYHGSELPKEFEVTTEMAGEALYRLGNSWCEHARGGRACDCGHCRRVRLTGWQVSEHEEFDGMACILPKEAMAGVIAIDYRDSLQDPRQASPELGVKES